MNTKSFLAASIVSLAVLTALNASAQTGSGNTLSALTDASATSVNIIEQNYAASEQLPAMPGMVTGPVTAPSLFSLIGRSAHITGLPLWSQMLFIPDTHIETTGKSGKTMIVFSGIDSGIPESGRPAGIVLDLSGRATGEIAGSITIESKPERNHPSDFPTLMHDMAHFIRSRKEFNNRRVTLLTIPETMSFTLAVDSKSHGISLSSALSRFFDGTVGVLGGLSGGTAFSDGMTAPSGTVGCTVLVLVDGPHNRTVDLTSSYRRYSAIVNGQGIDRNPGQESDNSQAPTKAKQAENPKP